MNPDDKKRRAELQSEAGNVRLSDGQNTAYQPSDAVQQAQQMLQDHTVQAPGQYQSSWQDQLNDIMAQIQNRQPFQYDLNGDKLYQQYKDQYTRQGKLAMQDTMGQAAQLTGGYGNSHAQMAGQQAFQGYMGQLNDRIPELYNLALSKYQADGQELMDRFSMLGAMEDQEYGRYRDSMADYYAELDRLTSQYNTERDYDYGRYADERDFAYGQYADDRQYAYQEERDRIQDEQWQREFDEAKRQYDQQYALQQQKSSSGGSAGGSGGSYKNKEPAKKEATLSSAGQSFMNNLPYPHAGSDINVWKNTVRTRLEKQFNEGKLSEDDVVIILKKLGIA